MTFVKDLIAVANREWEFFGEDLGTNDHHVQALGQDGTVHLIDKEAYGKYNDRIATYWQAIPAPSYKRLLKIYGKDHTRLDGTLRNLAWSAAFISFCMKEAGAGDAFPYSSGHATWIVASIKNRLKNKLNAPLVDFVLVRRSWP